ncbi:MAG: lytic murein transglycosylase [Alphaproteobacteria bacterium]|nr:lytic murein transglycosylase [Alphaproteobacteria bacterium]MCB9699999.1 lytic murein transglycosylase [Alphaproteobacteria bacterium]
MTTLLALLLACGSAPAPEPAPPPTPTAPPLPPPPPEPEKPEVDLTVPTNVLLARAKLLQAERAVVDPTVDDETAALWGHAMQRIARVLAADPVMGEAVLSGIKDEALAKDLRLVVHGTAEIAKTVTRPRTDLPDWRIERPPAPSELRGYYDAASQTHGVPWSALASIHLNETRMGRLRGVSPAGARGPMQFMPATWKGYGMGGDIESPKDAIAAAGNYLAKMGWAKDPAKAIWHYNQSEHYVAAIQDFQAYLEGDPQRYRGLWGWQVYYRTVRGSIWLSEGYEQQARIPIETWCDEKGEPWCPAPDDPK